MAAIYYCKICEKLIVDEDELPTVGTYCSKKCEKIFEKFGLDKGIKEYERREKVRKDRLSVHVDDDEVEVPSSNKRDETEDEPSSQDDLKKKRSGKNDRKSLIDALPYEDSVEYLRKQVNSDGNTPRERSRSRIEEPSDKKERSNERSRRSNNPSTIDTTHTPIYTPTITPTPTIIATPTITPTPTATTTTTPITQNHLSTSTTTPLPVENQSQTVPTYPDVKPNKHENYMFEDNIYDEPPPSYESICSPQAANVDEKPLTFESSDEKKTSTTERTATNNTMNTDKRSTIIPPKLPPKVPISNAPPLMNTQPHIQPPNQFFPHNNQQRPFYPTINQQNVFNHYGRSSSSPQYQLPLNVNNFGASHSHPSTSSTPADRFLNEQANLPSTVYPPPFYTIKKFGNNT
ncbi:12446_t:CDS:2 [Funneliformis mosseae]|uniref:12446_t:CDS:1 n=1 Tax=Funneliformis mosseae TaxID=27381 RepID=A0A9N8ZR21_FUNMO|nr:12446_t:CDS:2 [Funneliformis mosseae]